MLQWVVIGLASGTMLVLAGAATAILGWANRRFHVEVDPRVEAINGVLPSANCGGCGYVGCNEYAEALVRGGAAANLCTPGGAGTAEAIGEVLGVAVEAAVPKRAVVRCLASDANRKGVMPYHGERTCAAAHGLAGVQACAYGCLGFGDCVSACDFDALRLVNGAPVVDHDRCTGCDNCAKVCPRHVLAMVPFKAERMLVVACVNQDFGADVKAVCDLGCIGCKLCPKQSPVLQMQGDLAVIDYAAYDPASDFSLAIKKCSPDTLVWAGKGPPPEPAAPEQPAEAARPEPDAVPAPTR